MSATSKAVRMAGTQAGGTTSRARRSIGLRVLAMVVVACASHLSHPGCIKNADRSAGTGDGTIFAVRRA